MLFPINELVIKINDKALIISPMIMLVKYSILPWPKGCLLSAGFRAIWLPKIAIISVVKSLNECIPSAIKDLRLPRKPNVILEATKKVFVRRLFSNTLFVLFIFL